MSWMLVWVISAVGAAALMAFGAWWNMKLARRRENPDQDDLYLTLKEFIIGVVLALCPVVNTIVVLAMLVYIFTEVAPKIVLFGEKK